MIGSKLMTSYKNKKTLKSLSLSFQHKNVLLLHAELDKKQYFFSHGTHFTKAFLA